MSLEMLIDDFIQADFLHLVQYEWDVIDSFVAD